MYEVAQYAPTPEFGRRLDLTGLGAGEHTVVVESTATLYHDAFLAPTDAADPIPLAEDHSDGATRYAWARRGFGGASGLSYACAAGKDAATAFTCTGSSLTWKYVRRPDGGIAHVWIDGADKGLVDQFGGRPKRRGAPLAASVTYGGLGSGLHTVLIVNTGEKNASSSGFVVTSDAFVVGAVTFED
jgi:bacillopeptidase F